MPVRVTYTQLIDDFRDISIGLENASSILGEIGKFLEASILMRTSKGIDAEGLPLATREYSTPYKLIRQERNLPVDKVDLYFGGSMFGALTFEYNNEQARVFFADTPHVDVFRGTVGKTNAEIAYYNDQLRPFFSISAIEEEKIIRMFGDYVNDLLEE